MLPMAEVVILGAGFAGLTVYHQLRHRFGSDRRLRLTVIDERETFLVKPSLPEVAFGLKNVASATFPLRDTLTDARFVHSPVLAVDPVRKRVQVDGAWIPYDLLVLALGAVKRWEAVPGFAEAGTSVCTEVLAPRLQERMEAFQGGTILVGSAPTPTGRRLPDVPRIAAACEGPVGEVLFLADHVLRRRGLRNAADIVAFTPGPVFFEDVGEEVHRVFGRIADDHQIRVLTNRIITRIEPDGVRFDDGTRVEAALTVLVPPYGGPPVVEAAGLTDDAGFVPTDGDFRHLDHPDIFAVGDLATRSVPKLGHLAVLQATRLAGVLEREIRGQADVPPYEPEVFCIMNMGAKALLIRSNVLYGGHRDLAWYGTFSHTLKTMFDEYTVHFRGRMPPGVTQQLLNAYLDKVAEGSREGP